LFAGRVRQQAILGGGKAALYYCFVLQHPDFLAGSDDRPIGNRPLLAAQLSAARDDPARDRLSLISTLVREACIVQIDPRLDFQSQGKPDLYRPTCDTSFPLSRLLEEFTEITASLSAC
jgi:hypothetical protein